MIQLYKFSRPHPSNPLSKLLQYFQNHLCANLIDCFPCQFLYSIRPFIMYEIVKNKMVLKSLAIEEKLRDFTFKRFDENGVVFTDANNFYTNIKLLNKKFAEEE